MLTTVHLKRADRTVIVGNNNTGQLKLSSLSDSPVFIPRLKHGGLQRRFSVIPLHEGMPRIHSRRKGPKPRWSSHQRCGKNTVHFNRNHIGINTTKKNTDLTILSVKEGSSNLATGHEAEIHGPCRIVY